MKVIAVAGAKGGVGKTSIAVNLACLAADEGFATLLWDLDPQGSASHCCRVEPHIRGSAGAMFGGKHDLDRYAQPTEIEDLDLVAADPTLAEVEPILSQRRWPARAVRKMLHPLKEEYDLVVLDCPPGLGLLAEAAFTAADLVVAPIVPSPLALRSLEQTSRFIGERGIDTDLMAVLSMVDRRKVLHRQMLPLAETDDRFAGAAVPFSSAVERMGLEQVPSVLASPRSLGSATLKQLWREVRERVDLGD